MTKSTAGKRKRDGEFPGRKVVGYYTCDDGEQVAILKERIGLFEELAEADAAKRSFVHVVVAHCTHGLDRERLSGSDGIGLLTAIVDRWPKDRPIYAFWYGKIAREMMSAAAFIYALPAALEPNEEMAATALRTGLGVPDTTPDDVGGKRDNPVETTTLHPGDIAILQVLAKTPIRTWLQVDISEALPSDASASQRTVGKRLEFLRNKGLTHRPKGVRGGEAITSAGLRAIRQC